MAAAKRHIWPARARRRARGPMPADAWVVRPRRHGLVEVPVSRWRRAFTALGGALVVLIAFPLSVQDGVDVLAWALLIPPLAVMTAVMALRPRTFFYVHGDRVGIHLTFGTRYEVPADQVSVVRVALVSDWGVPTRGVVLESATGRRLLSHANARYDEDDLRELARHVGAELREDA